MQHEECNANMQLSYNSKLVLIMQYAYHSKNASCDIITVLSVDIVTVTLGKVTLFEIAMPSDTILTVYPNHWVQSGQRNAVTS